MPVVHPAEVWKESGRYAKIGPELVRFKDRGGAGHGPGDDPRGGRGAPPPRHRPELPPAADDGLPLPDQVPRRAAGTGRPDPRPRVRHEGRLQLRPRRGRPGPAATALQYEAYERIFRRLGLDAIVVGARRRDHGRLGRPRVHGRQRVRRGHPRPVRRVRLRGQPADRRRCASPTRQPEDAPADGGRRDARTRRPSRRSAAFLGVPRSRTAKAAFFVTGDGRFVAAIVRGDDDVNETKLVNAVKARGGLRPATVEEIKARGMEAGYGSPLGARDAVVVVDELVTRSPEPGGGREPGRLARPQRQRPPRLHAGLHRRDHERPRRRCLPPLRLGR